MDSFKGIKRLRGQTMTFDEALDQVRELLQQRGRVTYRSLKRQCSQAQSKVEIFIPHESHHVPASLRL